MAVLKFLVFVGCLTALGGVAAAKPICAHGWRFRIVHTPDNMSLLGCTNGKIYTGHVQVRDAKMRLVMDGAFRGGQMDGVWQLYDDKGHVVKHPMFDHGKLVAEDSMPDDEGDGGGGGE